jgi:hypothetical protein
VKIDWLEDLAARSSRKSTQTPLVLSWAGSDWTAATDGRLLVLLQGQGDYPPLSSVTLSDRPGDETLCRLLSEAQAAPVLWSGTVGMLQSWCGPRETTTRHCHTCEGSGRHECDCGHEHKCGWCGGEGTILDVPQRYGTVQDVVFDRNYLALALDRLPEADGCTLALAECSGGRMLYLAAMFWRVLLCCCTSTGGGGDRGPELLAEVVTT